MHLLFKVFAIVDSLFNVEPKPATKLFFVQTTDVSFSFHHNFFIKHFKKDLLYGEEKKGKNEVYEMRLRDKVQTKLLRKLLLSLAA